MGSIKTFNSKFIKISSTILFVLYLSYLIYLTFFDHIYGRGIIHRSINIIPFKTIMQFLSSLSSYNTDIIITNILGNIAAFMPMGFLLPLAFNRLNNLRKLVLTVFAATILIEVLQYITGVGAADIDDVILNIAGGLLGYLIYKAVASIIGLLKD